VNSVDQHRSRQQNHQDLRADQRQPGQPVHAGGGQLEAGVERRHRQQVVAGEEPVPPDEVEQRAEVERLLGAGGHQRVAEQPYSQDLWIGVSRDLLITTL
jgi:hypothetical protein